ncbi:DNA-binding transcriptional regulator, LysR family [Sinosporangium album]|uniref:DNA-binding transcriptional regulator, LysR family n=1 Tax=Sinosporangium album TaxID=504805 RepID=A0A1G8B1W4_9ACTN|nr:LysR family transcriptional regulator [Sinosporangium album]SDH27124.1 DNA-binding transcriptional regulator, LysR family [Sinosporangium album]
MELRQVEHFLAVAEELNFSRAATRLNLGQSAVSASVRALERDLNAALFARTSRAVRLTEAGRVFLPAARRLLAAARDARNDVSTVSGMLTGVVRVGLTQTLQGIDVPGALTDVRRRHPGLTLQLRQGYPNTLLSDVARGRLDLAVVPVTKAPPEGVRLNLLYSEDLVVVTPPGHRLADRATVDLTELAGEVWVEFLKGTTLRDATDAAARAARLTRSIVADVGQLPLLVDLVKAGAGIAIVPRSVAEQTGLLPITIRQSLPRRILMLAYPHSTQSTTAAAVVIEALMSARRRTSIAAVG